MKYLIDTHVALWVLKGDSISDNAKRVLDDTSLEIFISIASAWEIAIKISSGKMTYSGGVSAFLSDIKMNGFRILGIAV